MASHIDSSELADLREKIKNYNITEVLNMKLGKGKPREIRTSLICLDIFRSFGMYWECHYRLLVAEALTRRGRSLDSRAYHQELETPAESRMEGSESRGDNSLCIGPDRYASTAILKGSSDVL